MSGGAGALEINEVLVGGGVVCCAVGVGREGGKAGSLGRRFVPRLTAISASDPMVNSAKAGVVGIGTGKVVVQLIHVNKIPARAYAQTIDTFSGVWEVSDVAGLNSAPDDWLRAC